MPDKLKRTQETWDRIERAREHYRTRAERRPKGQSRSDRSLYDHNGRRLPGNLTLDFRQGIVLC